MPVIAVWAALTFKLVISVSICWIDSHISHLSGIVYPTEACEPIHPVAILVINPSHQNHFQASGFDQAKLFISQNSSSPHVKFECLTGSDTRSVVDRLRTSVAWSLSDTAGAPKKNIATVTNHNCVRFTNINCSYNREIGFFGFRRITFNQLYFYTWTVRDDEFFVREVQGGGACLPQFIGGGSESVGEIGNKYRGDSGKNPIVLVDEAHNPRDARDRESMWLFIGGMTWFFLYVLWDQSGRSKH